MSPRPPLTQATHASDVLRQSRVCVVILTRGPDVAVARARMLAWQRALGHNVPVHWAHVGPRASTRGSNELPPLPPLVTDVPGAAAVDDRADTGFARAANAALRTCGAGVRTVALVRADLSTGSPPPGFALALAAAVQRCINGDGVQPAVVSLHPPAPDPMAGHCTLPAAAFPLFEAHGQNADARVNALRLEANAGLAPPLALGLLPPLPQRTTTTSDALAVDTLAASLCGCHGRHRWISGSWPSGDHCSHRFSAYVQKLYDHQRAGQPLTVRLPKLRGAALLHYNNWPLTIEHGPHLIGPSTNE